MGFQRFGSYQILGRIGRGGMATVCLAKPDGILGLPPVVCLKTLRPEFQSMPELRLMLVDEAEIVAKLHHPNCIKTFESGEVDGASFLSMEYVIGETLDLLLRHAMKIRAPLLPEAVVAIVATICDALEYAHGLDIIHRDVSPENIMISDRGVAKLLDFGVAKARDRHQITATGAFKGKLSYLAPEQLTNEPVDRRCDVYQLGVTLYSCLTNRRPFEGLELEDLFVAKIYRTLPPASSLVPNLDPRLSAISAKALSRAPGDRFETAAEMAAALREVVPVEASEHFGAIMLHERLDGPVQAKRHAFERLLSGDEGWEVLKALRVMSMEADELPFSTDPQAKRRWGSDSTHMAELDAFSLDGPEHDLAEDTDESIDSHSDETDPPTMISARHLVPLDPAPLDDRTPSKPKHLLPRIDDLAVPPTGEWDDLTRKLKEPEEKRPPPTRPVVERASFAPPGTPQPLPPEASARAPRWFLFGIAFGFAGGLLVQRLYALIP